MPSFTLRSRKSRVPWGVVTLAEKKGRGARTTQPAPKPGKDLSVETLRGVAVLLLVAAHVVGYDRHSGMRVDDRSVYRYLYFSFEYFRMPLFTVISGYVYSLRPVRAGAVWRFLRGKARRILIPMATVSTLQYFLHMLPGVNRPKQLADIWQIYFLPFDQFWFLQAIFLVFLAVVAIDLLGLMDRFWSWLGCCSLAMLACLHFPHFTDIFSFIGALYLFPFFILGCGLKRHGDVLFRREVLIGVGIAFGIGVLLQQLTWFGVVSFIGTDRVSILGVLVGLGGGILLFRFRRHVPGLAKLGTFAYSIYLFHVWGTAGVRVVAGKIGIHQQDLLFLTALAAGLILPILFDRVLVRNAVTRRVFLGLR